MAVTRVDTQSILDGAITDSDIAAANKDGANSTPSFRTLNDVAISGTAATSGQAAPADDSRINFSPQHFRQADDSTLDPDGDGRTGSVYFPGVRFKSPVDNGLNDITLGNLYLLPFLATKSGNLSRMRFTNTTNGTNAKFNFALYSSVQDDGVASPGRALYPDALLASFGGGISITGLGIPLSLPLAGFSVEANKVYWIAYLVAAAAVPPTVRRFTQLDPMLGWNGSTTPRGNPYNGGGGGGSGLVLSGVTTTLPNPFPAPSSSLEILRPTAPLPLAGIAFSS